MASLNCRCQKHLQRIIFYYFPISLEFDGIKWGLYSFKFEDGWLSVNDFCEKIEEWWKSNEINGKTSFRMVRKLTAIKFVTKKWCKEKDQKQSIDTQTLFHDIIAIREWKLRRTCRLKILLERKS